MDALLPSITSALTSKPADKDALEAAIEDFVSAAEREGLEEKTLERAYEITLGGKLATSQSLSLLPSLVPLSPLGPRPILLTLSSLGAASVDLKVQRRALEQLVILLELGAVGKEGTEVLERLVSVVERGLEYRALRDATAALLCLVTRRHHVQEYRLRSLQSLIARIDSPSSSLLRLQDHYRSFRPEHVYEQTTSAVKGRKERTKEVEDWKELVRTAREGGERDEGEEGKEGRENKRRKISAHTFIPLPATYTTDLTFTSATMPLSDVRTLPSLAQHIDKVAFPSQAASVFSAVSGEAYAALGEDARTRVWATMLRCAYGGDSEHIDRLSRWLLAQLQYELYDLEPSKDGYERVEDLLARGRELSELGGELVEHFEPFLSEFLQTWDGKQHRQVVFDWLALLKPLEYNSLYAYFFRHLDRISSTAEADAEWLAEWVRCLTSLVQHLAERDDWDEEVSRRTAFGQLDHGKPYLGSLQSILDYADSTITAATHRFPASLILRSAAFTFYETALDLPLEHGLPVIVFPSATLGYTALLSGEAMSVSRVCGLNAKLREALTGPSSALSKDDPQNTELVGELNRRLVDFVNALWQKKFLVASSGGEEWAMGMSGDDLDLLRALVEGRSQTAGSSQSLTTHAALAPLAKEHYAGLAEEQGAAIVDLVGPVSASSIKQLSKDSPSSATLPSFNDFRPLFLENLRDQGATGIHDFLFSSLQSLINRRDLAHHIEGVTQVLQRALHDANNEGSRSAQKAVLLHAAESFAPVMVDSLLRYLGNLESPDLLNPRLDS
ncbi:hypothetical protein JCM8097_006262 [Rhodosporidiobolus ruineniae]